MVDRAYLQNENGTVDRELREQLFRERVARFRKEYFRFVAGAGVITMVIAAGIGYFLYLVLSTLLFQNLTREVFLAIYGTCFFITGYAQHIHRTRRNPESPWNQFWDTVDHSRYWFIQGLGVIRIFWFPFTIPALVFHFLEEILTGRHLFASEEVEELAFEILYDGGEKISPEFLQNQLDLHPQILARAIQLLLEMKLLILRRGRSRRALLRSLAGKEFLEQVLEP